MRQTLTIIILPKRIARKVINERAVLTHCPVHNTPQAMEIIMNEKDYSADFTIASAARITIRDYSDYDSNLCHDGGHYATGVTFIRHPDGWERQEYTSGDYCPYCGSFDCCGSCEEAEAAAEERLTDAEVMDEVDHYRGQADTAIMYQPV